MVEFKRSLCNYAPELLIPHRQRLRRQQSLERVSPGILEVKMPF